MERQRCAIFPSSWACGWCALGAAIAWSPPAEAREPPPVDIAARTLPEALAELARESVVSIGTDGALPAIRVAPIRGRMSIEAALRRLLARSGLRARRVGPTAWRIEPAPGSPNRPPAAAPGEGEAPPPTFVATGPIIVTGAKRDRSLETLPMAVKLVAVPTAQRRSPSAGTAFVASEAEGLALTGLGPGRNRMFLRGVADSPFNGPSQATVAVVLDESRLTYSAPDPDIRLVDVARVELLEGPQGSLYGTGVLGGIYHIVTRRAEFDETSLDLSVGGEATASGGLETSETAIANLPLVRGRAGLRLVGYAAHSPGWVDTGARTDSNRERLLGARAALGADLGGSWRADLTGFAQMLDSRDSQYVYRPGARSRPAQFAEPHDNDLSHLAGRIERRGGAIAVTLSSGITWHDVGDRLDATVGADGFGIAAPQTLSDQRRYRVWDSEARMSGTLGRIEWLAGLAHLDARQHVDLTLNGAGGVSSVISADRRTAVDNAAYFDATLPLSRTIKLSAGGRLFDSSTLETRDVAGERLRLRLDRTGVTPSAALAWEPRAGRLAFVRYASAYRQGTAAIAADGTPQKLAADELITIDAGWRETLAGGGRFELAGYLSIWEDMQSDVLLPDGLVETRTAGDARILGLEASLDLPFGRGWRASAGATYQNAQLTRNALGFGLNDTRLPVVPEYTLRGAIAREFGFAGGAGSLRLALRYLGPARLSFDPALDRPMGRLLESRLEGRIAWNRLALGFEIENLLGRHSDSFAFGNPLRFATMRQYTPQEPLRLSVTLSRGF